ncbi:Sip1-related alpha-galactosidase [Cohnella yongneupensis]|uniref:Sip1-related alpha-galactosidase n=1 Tax=Cohnella yongneupensis TaxID=425006 RepID=A0ABW0QZQ1_9BACL
MNLTLEEIRGSYDSGAATPVGLQGVKRWLALARTDLYWMEPSVGVALREVPAETQFMLWEREDGRFGLLLPIVSGDYRATLEGSDSGLLLKVTGGLPDTAGEVGTVAYVCTGDDPHALVEQAMQEAADRLKTFRTRKQKKAPAFLGALGWCTWDAFYHTVDESKLMAGLESFRSGGVTPGFVILDDGAWDTEGDLLKRIAIRDDKFPSGLKSVIEVAKSDFGVRWFGVWHAFQGYWGGIHPDGPLALSYRWLHNRAVIRPWDPKLEDLYLIDPRDVYRFYKDLYRYLADAGVDLVKVDGQSALEMFSGGLLGRGTTMRAYQEAMQTAAHDYFDDNLIHCMCHGSDVPYHMRSSSVWRNSQDYFPERGTVDQQKHVFVNAMNNVWSSSFAIPDWDMFQTHQPDSAFHAAARAISGGPIYVCDKPGMQNFDILDRLTVGDGEALRCDEPALPAADCLFVDCYEEPRLLKIVNRTGSAGLLGLFHCYRHGGEIEGAWKPSDIPGLEGERFAVYRNRAATLQVMGPDESGATVLGAAEYEIVSCTPIRDGLAPIGLLDKFNHAAAIEEWSASGPVHRIRFKDGGKSIGMYCDTAPSEVRVDGLLSASYTYERSTGLLVLSATQGKSIVIEVILPGEVVNDD